MSEFTVVDENGEIRDDIRIVLPSDERTYCKLYQDGITVLSSLSSCAIKILMYMVYSMQFGNTCLFKSKECLRFTGYRNRQYIYKGLTELKSKGVIKNIHKGLYSINDEMFLKGKAQYRNEK